MDNDALQLFVDTQNGVSSLTVGTYQSALGELRQGRKQGHWIWYVLPQAVAQGEKCSEMQMRFRLSKPASVMAYAAHPVLGPRYLECVDAVVEALSAGGLKKCAPSTSNPTCPKSMIAQSTPVIQLMGSAVDVRKLYMSLSTFLVGLSAADDCDSNTNTSQYLLHIARALVAFLLNIHTFQLVRMVDRHLPEEAMRADAIDMLLALWEQLDAVETESMPLDLLNRCKSLINLKIASGEWI